MPFPASITATQQFEPKISPKDRKGRDTQVQDGTVVWASSNDAVATIGQSPEGKPLVVAQGPGEVDISVIADADLSEGVSTITGSAHLVVTQGSAVSVGLDAGPVEEQP